MIKKEIIRCAKDENDTDYRTFSERLIYISRLISSRVSSRVRLNIDYLVFPRIVRPEMEITSTSKD